MQQQWKDEIWQRNPGAKIYQFFAPARINLIGEHIDYVGGNVMPAAIDLGIHAYATKKSKITIKSLNIANKWFQVKTTDYAKLCYDSKLGFMNYVHGVLHLLQDQLKPTDGFEVVLHSSIPMSSGLSSSAAFGMLIIEILNQFYQIGLSKVDKALLFKRVENEFINLQSGIMDQFAIAFGKRDHFIKLNTATLAYQYVVAPMRDYRFLLISTNKARELAGSAYNKRVDELAQVSQQLGYNFKELATTAKASDFARISDPTLQLRLMHVVSEQARVDYIQQHLATMSGQELGQVLQQSHLSLRDCYNVSCPELEFVFTKLLDLPGVYGGRLIGAGFGGCFLAVVARDFDIRTITFNDQYKQQFGFKFDVYEFAISEGLYGREYL